MTNKPHPTGLEFLRCNPRPDQERCNDDAVRAICLALDLDYWTVYYELEKVRERASASYVEGQWQIDRHKRAGLLAPKLMEAYLSKYAWQRTELPEGTRFYAEHLPPRCIAEQATHFVCVRNGAVWDSWDSRGKRWKKLRAYYAPLNPALFP